MRTAVCVPSYVWMRRPDWVPVPAWSRLHAVLCGQPVHAQDAVDDLAAIVSGWGEAARDQLLERFVQHAERGLSLPVATILSLSDLLDRDA